MPRIEHRSAGPPIAQRAAEAIKRAFDGYHTEFKRITRLARQRFETCDWHAAQADTVERLEIYPRFIQQALERVKDLLEPASDHAATWRAVKHEYGRLIANLPDFELAETFFNSVVRKQVEIAGVDNELAFVSSHAPSAPENPDGSFFSIYPRATTMEALISDLLRAYRFETPYVDRTRDARLVARSIETRVLAEGHSGPVDSIELVDPVFYRNKSAFLIGRIHCAGHALPLVLPLLNTGRGIVVDAALVGEDDASILFSFTRSYFHVEVEAPYHLIQFLKSIMPLKRLAELYISIGHNKHGKTELYRDLLRHLTSSTDKFEIAPGEKGMVMIVFTLPSYEVVFKVIRDTFAYPKNTVRQQVMEKYNLVFKHDRAGRLVDAQEFENWGFDRARFSEAVLNELKDQAAGSVRIEGDSVVIAHLYTERRLTPLNLYLREAAPNAARDAVIDYGQTVKDLAATNIFPGDLLLKNFGVTRHGRVVFYDYDELCLLSDCNFRILPEARTSDDELLGEPWYYVGENDIFPEEFIQFLGLRGDLREEFLNGHRDLLGVEFWTGMQERLRSGEIIDIFAYKKSQRFPWQQG